ncbi:hypothetical protein BG011_006273 [Mortierella polycephala]|uniref:Copper transport protein n=1 Tax=Mortierella polycephala TaxID=41804 RepID=A0A9P6U841_9FUNG|nr:hypothetical protein BG011_006273 [Mortierella polycephala]
MTAGFKPGFGTAVWSPELTPMSEPEYIGALIGLFLLSVGFRALVAAQGYLEAYLHLHFYPRPSRPPRSQFCSNPQVSLLQTQGQAGCQPPQNNNLCRQGQDDDEEQLQQLPLQGAPMPEIRDEKCDDKILTDGQQEDLGVRFSGQRVQQQQQDHHNSGVINSVTPSGRKRYGPFRHHLNAAPFARSSWDQQQQMPTSLIHPLPTAQPFVWQADVTRAVLTTAIVAVGYMLMLVIMTYNSAYFAVILVGVFVGEIYFGRWGRVRPIFPSSSSSSSSAARNQSRSPYNHESVVHDERQSPATASMTSFTSSTRGYSSAIQHMSADAAC